MFNNIQFTCILVVFYGICSSLGQTLPDETLYIDNACYGSSAGSYFHSNCSTNHAIAVSKVLGGAKPNTTGCPPEDDGNHPANFSVCCVSSSADCIEEFSGALKTYHDGCSGEQVCKPGTGATIYRFVNCQKPLVNNSFNSYMQLDYYCIDKTTIGSTCTPVSMTMSGTALYLWNSGYPFTATADCNCSIEVNSSTAKIEVMALRIELFGNSSNCIRFLDGVCDTRETVFCSNQSTITNIYTSTSNYLLMEYIRGQINDSGRYWIRFKATNSSANLIVKCQPESKPVCTTTTTTTPSTTTSTTTPSTTTSTTTPSTTTYTTRTPSTTTTINTTTNSTITKTSTVTSTHTPKTSEPTRNTTGLVIPSTTTEEISSTGVIIGVVVGVVCFILLIVVIVIIYMRIIKPARDRKEADVEKKQVEQGTEPADSMQESMIKQEAFSGGRNSAPPAATQFKQRDKADTFTEERCNEWREKDDNATHQSMQNISLSSVLTNGNVLGDHQNDNGAGDDEKKKSRKKKVKRKMVNEANQDIGHKSMQSGENVDDSVTSLLAVGLSQNDRRSKKHKKRKKGGHHHLHREDDDPQLREQSWREEDNVMSYDATLTKFEIYNENGEGRGRKKKGKKRKGKKRSERVDDVDNQDLEQIKVERHNFETKVHPEHQGEHNEKEMKEEKKKKKMKKKKLMEEEEGEEMKDGIMKDERMKINQHRNEEEGVQSEKEMKRERKKKKQYAEEEKEMHNGEYVEGKKKRKHTEEEDGVQSDEEIREETKKIQEKHREDLVQNDEEMKKKRKKKKKKQRHQKEEREDGHD